ncbi:MAG: elongation factor P [Nitriliruptorales bacterium]|nr:elongation factor P [Nitriliruptorales bacterium]
MVSTNNLKNGMTLNLEGVLWQVVSNEHHKPGKGQAVVRTRLKQVESGKVVERTFRAGEDVEQAIVQKKTLQFLYRDGDDFVVMDAESYEQTHLSPEVIGEGAQWILEGDEIAVQEYEGRIVGIDLPAAVTLEVTHTEPGLAGDTATTTFKPATLETGVEVQVPLFVNIGDRIKVDTRSGEYLSRG